MKPLAEASRAVGGLVDLDDAGDFVERLDGDVVELRVRAGGEVVEGDGEAGVRCRRRSGRYRSRGPSSDLPVTTSVCGKITVLVAGDPVVDFDGAGDSDVVARRGRTGRWTPMASCSAANLAEPRRVSCFMKCCVDEFAVGDERFGQRQADHAGGELGFGVDERVVDEHELRGGGVQGRSSGRSGRRRCGRTPALAWKSRRSRVV